MLSSPALALDEVKAVLWECAVTATDNTKKSLTLFSDFSAEKAADIRKNENKIDALTDASQAFLVKLCSYPLTDRHNELLNYYIKCSSEFERIGDYAVNLTENAEELVSKGRKYSKYALHEVEVLTHALNEIMEMRV